MNHIHSYNYLILCLYDCQLLTLYGDISMLNNINSIQALAEVDEDIEIIFEQLQEFKEEMMGRFFAFSQNLKLIRNRLESLE